MPNLGEMALSCRNYGPLKLRKTALWGGANGEMANLTNEKGKFAIAIFRHFSPFFAIFRHW